MKIGLVGYGYWGSKWARVLDDAGVLAWVVDADTDRAHAAYDEHDVSVTDELRHVLHDCDGAIIATPPSQHYPQARQLLNAGKHVLVEKPMTCDAATSLRLVEQAQRVGRVLMVGHTFLYALAVRRLYRLHRTELRPARYYRFQWTNRGRVRDDVDVVWNVGPHPFSILLYLRPEMPQHIDVQASAWVEEGHWEIVDVSLRYRDGAHAHVHLSWLDPEKERSIKIIGAHAEALCHATKQDLTLWRDQGEDKKKSLASGREPLGVELTDFVQAIQHYPDYRPLADGLYSGARVVGLLERISGQLVSAPTAREVMETS